MRFLSQVYTIARGSVGGITYTANQFHQLIARARTAPVQPNTTPQSNIRSCFIGAADDWNALSILEQDGWELYGQNTKWPGPLGPHSIPGRQACIAGLSIRRYIALAYGVGVSGPNTPPAPLTGFYNLKNVAAGVFATGSDTGVAISFTAEVSQDVAWLAELSPAFQPARRRYKGPWDVSQSQAAILAANNSITVPFGGLVDGAVYFIRLRGVADDAAARISPAFIVRAIAVTNP